MYVLYSTLLSVHTCMYLPTLQQFRDPFSLLLRTDHFPFPGCGFFFSLLSQQIKLLVPKTNPPPPPARDRGPSWEGKRIVFHLDRRPT